MYCLACGRHNHTHGILQPLKVIALSVLHRRKLQNQAVNEVKGTGNWPSSDERVFKPSTQETETSISEFEASLATK